MNMLQNLQKKVFASKTQRQLVSYVIIGIAHNGASFFVYLLLTYYGMSPQIAVTILYPLGIVISFFANRKFTFKNTEGITKAAIAYGVLYATGYFINIVFLHVFYQHFGIPHQLVQIGTAGFLVVYFFVMSKFFVFR